MLFLKQSTPSQAVLIGPFVDDADGASAETGLSIANTDIRLSKNGGNMAPKNSGGGTHDENGWYTVTLDATDTDTVGPLQLSCKKAGALAVFTEFQVLEEAIHDALFGAAATAFDGSGRVNVGAWLGTTPLALASQRVQTSVGAMGSGVITSSVFGSGAITQSAIASNAITSVQIAANAIGSSEFAQAAADKIWASTTRTLTAATNITSDGNAITAASGVVGAVASVTGGINTGAGTITTLDGLDTAQDTQHAATLTRLGAPADGDIATDIANLVDQIFTDAHSEPSGVPAANEALATKIGYLFLALRNRVTVTADDKTFHDAGNNAEFKKALSDDDTTYTEGVAEAP